MDTNLSYVRNFPYIDHCLATASGPHFGFHLAEISYHRQISQTTLRLSRAILERVVALDEGPGVVDLIATTTYRYW